MKVFKRIFGHSHDHHEHVGDVLQASSEGLRALAISFGGLMLTAVLQVFLVLVSGSVALLADTIHNFGDALTALPLGVAFLLSRRHPTRRYTFGYGRAEDLAGAFVVLMIAISAGVAGWESARRLFEPTKVQHIGWVVVAGLIGFVGNEIVAVYRIRVGRRIGSAALVADGLHARTDGLTSLAVVVGALGVVAGFPLADPIVGLLITVAILGILRSAARDVYRRLMDAVDPNLVGEVEDLLRSVPGIDAVDSVRLRWVGHELRAECEIVSDPRLTLVEAHAISAQAHHLLLHQVPHLRRASIHTSPRAEEGTDHHALLAHHSENLRS
ncbi:MAG: cation diffusion facilitator family transporter [Actinomycetota bacterium]|nr:cation transporter [Actinomycetota bacterium]